MDSGLCIDNKRSRLLLVLSNIINFITLANSMRMRMPCYALLWKMRLWEECPLFSLLDGILYFVELRRGRVAVP